MKLSRWLVILMYCLIPANLALSDVTETTPYPYDSPPAPGIEQGTYAYNGSGYVGSDCFAHSSAPPNFSQTSLERAGRYAPRRTSNMRAPARYVLHLSDRAPTNSSPCFPAGTRTITTGLCAKT